MASLDGTTARSWVGDTKVVARGTPFHWITDPSTPLLSILPARNRKPFTVRVRSPLDVLARLALEMLDRTLPLCVVNLWYGVGSKDEAEGRWGFAHL
jgi:hypothetical protein